MGSLSDLNDYSTEIVDFVDNRNAGPRFNFDDPQDDLTRITDTGTIDLYRDQLEIIDVIRADEANLQFIVDVSAVPGTVVNFPDLYVDLVNNVNGVYTLSYITSVADWNAIKESTITIDPDYQGSFIYDVTLKWYDGTTIQTLEWRVGEFVPVSLLANNFDLGIDYLVTSQLESEMTTIFGFDARFEDVQIITVSSLTADGIAVDFADVDLTTTTTFELYSFMTSVNDLNYVGNIQNENKFPAGRNYVVNPDPSRFNFSTATLILTIEDGEWWFGDQTQFVKDNTDPNPVITLSGTLSEINTEIANLVFLPDYNYSQSLKVLFELKDAFNNTVETDFFRLRYSGAGTITTDQRSIDNDYMVTSGVNDYYPTEEQKKYGALDVILVAGGGSGQTHGASFRSNPSSFDVGRGGGSGGGALEKTNIILDNVDRLFIGPGPGGLIADPNISEGAIQPGGTTQFDVQIWQGLFYDSQEFYEVIGGNDEPRDGFTAQSGYPTSTQTSTDPYVSMASVFNTDTNLGGYGNTNPDNNYAGAGGAGAGSNAPESGLTNISRFLAPGGKSVEASWLPGQYFGGGGGGGYNINGSEDPGEGGFQSGGNGAYKNLGSGVDATVPGYGGGGGGSYYDAANDTYYESSVGGQGVIIFRIRAK